MRPPERERSTDDGALHDDAVALERDPRLTARVVPRVFETRCRPSKMARWIGIPKSEATTACAATWIASARWKRSSGTW
jgi:hypothetical protein